MTAGAMRIAWYRTRSAFRRRLPGRYAARTRAAEILRAE